MSPAPLPDACLACHGVGWVLDGDPERAPLTLDLAPCPEGCRSSGQPIEVLSLGGRFRRAVLHPSSRAVMSVTGATAAHLPALGAPVVDPDAEEREGPWSPPDTGLLSRDRRRRRILPPGARPTAP